MGTVYTISVPLVLISSSTLLLVLNPQTKFLFRLNKKLHHCYVPEDSREGEDQPHNSSVAEITRPGWILGAVKGELRR